MYNVTVNDHHLYGQIIEISIIDIGNYLSPFQAINVARTIRRTFLEQNITKIRFLINEQILTIKQLEKWALEEYKTLPKCADCFSILQLEVFTHQYCGKNLFCSQRCADLDYLKEIEKRNDELEIDYLR